MKPTQGLWLLLSFVVAAPATLWRLYDRNCNTFFLLTNALYMPEGQQRPIIDFPGNQPTHCITTILYKGYFPHRLLVWPVRVGYLHDSRYEWVYSNPHLEFLNADAFEYRPKVKDRLIAWNLH